MVVVYILLLVDVLLVYLIDMQAVLSCLTI